MKSQVVCSKVSKRGRGTRLLIFLIAMLTVARSADAYDSASVSALIQDNRCNGCDFSGAPLRSRDFPGAKLSGANLSGADLRFVNFSGADLRGASLNSSDLTGANLSGARIDAADLGNVIFCQTVMPSGIERSDECMEGTWRESDGAVMLMKRNANNGFDAILASGAYEHVGSVLMRNLTRAKPGIYTGEQLVVIENERIWLATECVVAGPQMHCLDGMLVFGRVSTVAVRPAPSKLRRSFEYKPKEDIGAPTNLEGAGSR